MTNDPKNQPKSVKLITAIENGDLEQVKCLLDTGVDINKCPPGLGLSSPLAYAVAYGHLEIVETLLLAGAYPFEYILLQLEPNSEEKTLKILSLLINAGINVNFQLEEADTLLMKAAGRGELDFVKLLLSSGADVNQTNQYGESALLYAAYGGWQEVYDCLAPLTSPELRTVAEKSLRDGLLYRHRKSDQLESELFSAAANGAINTMLDTIEKGANINTIGTAGNSVLYSASAWGHVSVVRTLISAGADINLGTEKNGKTPLIASVENIPTVRYFGGSDAETEQMKVVRLLIKAGANINIKTSDGWTALMAAANSGSIEAVELLLQAGADINAKDNQGDTALSRALKAGHPEIVQLLRDAGATED